MNIFNLNHFQIPKIYIWDLWYKKWIKLQLFFIHLNKFLVITDPSFVKPHFFDSPCLKSASLKEIKQVKQQLNISKSDYLNAKKELSELNKADVLENMLPDVSRNNTMNYLMTQYRSFFDEESGNTREQGIDQLKTYLREDLAIKRKFYMDALRAHDKAINGESSSSKDLNKGESSNMNSTFILAILPKNIYINIILRYLISLLNTIFIVIGFIVFLTSIGFMDISFYITDYIIDSILEYISNLVYIKYEIIITIPLFLWNCISFIRKLFKYISFAKKMKDTLKK